MGFAFILESVGGTEWFVLLGVVLIVVGPKNLPAAARKLGQVMTNLRRAADEFKRQLMTMDQEVRNTVNDAMTVDPPASTSSSSDSSGEDAPEESEDLYSDDNPYPGHDDYYDESYGGDYGNGSDEDGLSDGESPASDDAGEPSEPSEPVQPPPPSDEELRRVTITVSSAPRKGK